MDIKFLSRKFALSMILGIISVILLMKGNINESQFGIVIMATVVSYIISKTIDKKYGDSKITYPVILDRLTSLFSREFLIAIFGVLGISYLSFIGKISGDLWFQVVTMIGGTYNIFNSVEKMGK